ncbi:MAG: hypothetical protein K940chlam9_00113 [Chlamydiae bacterium]|nr:hypothetical protein [Chlamydiota bacterium]
MGKVNWKEILGWGDEQLAELRLAGFSFLRQGHYEKALLFFEGLVVLDPKSAYDIQTLGALYLQMGKGLKALSALNQALTLDPKHEPTLLNKSKALLQLHRKQEALALANVLKMSKDPTIMDDAIALMLAYS